MCGLAGGFLEVVPGPNVENGTSVGVDEDGCVGDEVGKTRGEESGRPEGEDRHLVQMEQREGESDGGKVGEESREERRENEKWQAEAASQCKKPQGGDKGISGETRRNRTQKRKSEKEEDSWTRSKGDLGKLACDSDNIGKGAQCRYKTPKFSTASKDRQYARKGWERRAGQTDTYKGL